LAAEIYWLASYPKSGNTWLRILLAHYFTGEGETTDLNDLPYHCVPPRAFLDEWTGIKTSTMTAAAVDELRPAAMRIMAAEASGRLILKVHDGWWRTAQGDPWYPSDITKGVIYVIRNPLDVAVSAAAHWNVDIAKAVSWLADPDYSVMGGFWRLDLQLPQRIGGWSDHVRSWLDDSGLPLHLVRYEDLKAGTEAAFRGVLRFLGETIDEGKLAAAVAASRFAALAAKEQQQGFRERPMRSQQPFFRRGEVGSWKSELPPELARALVDRHGETMRRFGYLPDGAP
jgi:aryl sulfotransferase